VSVDYFDKVSVANVELEKLNYEILKGSLLDNFNISLGSIDNTLLYREVNAKRFSPYHFASDYIVIISNPSREVHQELIDLEIPFKNFTMFEIEGDTMKPIVFDYFEPM